MLGKYLEIEQRLPCSSSRHTLHYSQIESFMQLSWLFEEGYSAHKRALGRKEKRSRTFPRILLPKLICYRVVNVNLFLLHLARTCEEHKSCVLKANLFISFFLPAVIFDGDWFGGMNIARVGMMLRNLIFENFLGGKLEYWVGTVIVNTFWSSVSFTPGFKLSKREIPRIMSRNSKVQCPKKQYLSTSFFSFRRSLFSVRLCAANCIIVLVLLLLERESTYERKVFRFSLELLIARINYPFPGV